MTTAKLARVDALAPGETRVVAIEGSAPPKRSIVLVRLQDSGASEPLGAHRAYWNICQHLPIPLDSGTGIASDGTDILCVTHGARYRPSDGYCHSGPCQSESLEAVELSIRDGWIIATLSS